MIEKQQAVILSLFRRGGRAVLLQRGWAGGGGSGARTRASRQLVPFKKSGRSPGWIFSPHFTPPSPHYERVQAYIRIITGRAATLSLLSFQCLHTLASATIGLGGQMKNDIINRNILPLSHPD